MNNPMSTAAHPERTREEWQHLDRQHHLHPFTDFKELAGKGSRIISRAEGAYVWDVDGHQILDGMAGLWCVNVGYGRKEIADAVYAQMLQLPYYNNFFQTAHPPAIELASQLTALAPRFKQVFFTGSGSEANDTVLRMIWRYWQLLDQPQRRVVISRKNAYHGSTLGGASLGGFGVVHEQMGHLIPDIVHINQPYWYGEGQDMSAEEFGLLRARELRDTIEEIGADKVAAFIGEPIQGAGGVIIPPATYWPEIQKICDEYGILLVTDEVICGFGRTGKWFGADYFGVKPDLMPVAKGITSGYIPLGGVMVSERVSDVLMGDAGEFYHGFTYSGHPVACAAALTNLSILHQEHLVTRIKDDIGPYLQQQLRTLQAHPLVGEVRGLGLFGAIELVADKASHRRFDSKQGVGMRCREHCFQNGLIMRAVGDTMIIAPPFIISHAQVDELVSKAWKCLDLTARSIAS
ncbi:aspartate aminotransferase family protein [Pokkaliibacter sp. MBI-7]|uniref:aspartate aminotransferase family protein n=1 Tax=Pokkaliibacter sp. MBI-7 TaxID=3040600 RepID=UPI00244D73CA|nr:aspartate aminotransferase family protein [Pokkaliibacter sp. MBI-7]MDH2432600.1 aspartate aminotransferase family protein [Pokkaliibacter sp. MBI-7]